jgi:hypothetical protein
MTIHKAVPRVLLLVIGLILFFPVVLLLETASATLAGRVQYLNAPVPVGAEELSSYINRIVWLSGSLVPADEAAFVVGPYSETRCLAYHVEKWRGEWETDSDGDSYRVWVSQWEDRRSVPLNLHTDSVSLICDPSTGIRDGVRVAVKASRTPEYLNLVPSAAVEKTVDGDTFRYTEQLLPLKNTVWVVGLLQDGRIRPVEDRLLVSYGSPEPIARRLWGDAALPLYCALLLIIIALGCLVGCIALILRGKRMFPRPAFVAVVGAVAAYFWVVAGGVFESLAAGSLVPVIIFSIGATLLFLGPVAEHKGAPRLPVLLLFVLPSLALDLGAAWLLNRAFYALTDRLWLSGAGILLYAGAVTLSLFWYFRTSPRPVVRCKEAVTD